MTILIDFKKNNTIGILATGDEITQGNVLNTNTRDIAQALFSAGLNPTWHMSVSDETSEIEAALNFLLGKCAIVITIGGLGPTSDDKTRFAIAHCLNEPLVTDVASFEYLKSRYDALNMPFTLLSQQQALFPEHATILLNHQGSANGCHYVNHQHQHVFMLPGPPHECLPMFRESVLPILIQQYATHNILLQWKVFGVPEGVIANQVDTALAPYADSCRTGFRWDYPYVDCKVLLDENHPEKTKIIALLDALLKPHQLDIAQTNQSATEQLKAYLIAHPQQPICIDDHATGGVLETRLRSPGLPHVLMKNADIMFHIEGLENYWRGEESAESTITITSSILPEPLKLTVPFRKKWLEVYAAELVAYHIHRILAL